MNREQKATKVEELREMMSKVDSIVLTEYSGLTVEEMFQLRNEMRKEKIHYKVIKNTLFNRAVEGTAKAALSDYLKGPIGIAYSLDDPLSPAKALTNYIKKNEKLGLKVGFFDGRVLNASQIETLSKLPGKEVLRSQFLGTLVGVPSKFVNLLANVPRGLMNVLEARKKNLESQA